ncbi:glycosyltransferase [Ancylobacter sp.]|uniref:glycosyltransferase n=1 Tax=Ancylobacter sp. TaxID=1872567 RepID=UPI003C7C54EE
MKIIVISQHDPNIFPHMYYIARGLRDMGHEVVFISSVSYNDARSEGRSLRHVLVSKSLGWRAKVPFVRANYHALLATFIRERPDWIITQHEYVVPAVFYRFLPVKRAYVAASFVDFHGARRYVRALKPLAGVIDAYLDVCEMRVAWQKDLWPRMVAPAFVARNAALRQPQRPFAPHAGPARVVLTGSALLMLEICSPARLGRFIERLCAHGVSLDWYIHASPGKLSVALDAARGLCAHPLYRVHGPLPKRELLAVIGDYDAGLFWAPLADADLNVARDRSVFVSAASNKICEYIAAGLVVAHTGNPGLSYLPADVSFAFDATDPEAAADQLAAALSDRPTLERKRQAALQYHQTEMNFEAQIVPFLDYVDGRVPPR